MSSILSPTIVNDIVHLLGGLADQSLVGKLAVSALAIASLALIAAVLVKPWRDLVLGAAICVTLLWAVCGALVFVLPMLVAPESGRRQWVDRLFLTAVWLWPAALAWILGLLALGMLRAGMIVSILWALVSAALLLPEGLQGVAFAGFMWLVSTALVWALGLATLGARRWITTLIGRRA